MKRWKIVYTKLPNSYVEDIVRANYFQIEDGAVTFYHKVKRSADLPVLVYFNVITVKFLEDMEES